MGEDFFALTKKTLISAFAALPIILITVTGFFATSTANVGMMILFLGQIFAIPVLQILLGLVRNFGIVRYLFRLNPSPTYGSFNRLCSLSPADVKDDQTVPPISYWLAHLIFFGSYMISNAWTLYSVESEAKDPDKIKVENRKAQALTALTLTGLVVIGFTIAHMVYSGCDTVGSLFMGLALYGPMGYGFFKLAEICGLRSADLFGIATKLFTPPGSEGSSLPYACVKITQP